jgi:hypothetical protein
MACGWGDCLRLTRCRRFRSRLGRYRIVGSTRMVSLSIDGYPVGRPLAGTLERAAEAFRAYPGAA